MNPCPADAHAPLGLLGGTFDPIHFGHLRLAQEAHEALRLERVLLIPAGQPPHRDTPRSNPAHRLAMAQLAASGNAHLAVDAGEVFASGQSYTVLTLERLRQAHGPERPLVLILGADAFAGLSTWHRWRELLDFAHIAVATRPGYAVHPGGELQGLPPELDSLCAERRTSDPAVLRHAPAGRIIAFAMTPLAISASLIRKLIHDGRSARYLLPDPVLDYIGLHHLYNGN